MNKQMSRFYAAKYIFLSDRTEEKEWKCGHSCRMKQIGELMRIERQNRKVSLRELAFRLSMSAAYLSDMERGNRMYSLIHQEAARMAMRRAR